jgi:predicted DNA repair protein MutK
MAGSSLFALIDDIATLLDDVSVMTKVAAKKTAGVLGDDLALNANQVAGVNADRELPVVWAVAKGSTINKVILVPAALAIAAFAPWAIPPLLIIGGAFLCFEGVEKLAHRWLHPAEGAAEEAALRAAVADESVDMVAFEKDKIKGAIRTDFILSAEIIVIALGTVATQPLVKQFGVLAGISVLMTVGVYGLVAGIVKIDDVGLWLQSKASAAAKAVGRAMLVGAPLLMKFLSIAGTAAMFLVGGSIFVHNVPLVHHLVQGWAAMTGAASGVVAVLLEALIGVLVGALVLAAVEGFKKLKR